MAEAVMANAVGFCFNLFFLAAELKMCCCNTTCSSIDSYIVTAM